MSLGQVSNALVALTPTCTANIHLRPEKGGNTPAAGDEVQAMVKANTAFSELRPSCKACAQLSFASLPM